MDNDKVQERRRKEAEIRDYLIERACEEKVKDQRHVNRRAAVAAGRDSMLLEDLEQSLKRIFKKGYATPKIYKGKKAKHTERIVNIVLSDLHYQSLLDPRECPIEYGPIQESRRTGKVAAQVADYKRQYRHETKLNIHIIGDIIQNQLHDAREGAPLTTQFAAALHYLNQFVMFEAGQYPEVEVFCTPGNHGRNKWRHLDRAVNQKWDGIEGMLYVALRAAVLGSGLKNVKFNIPITPYYTVKLFDQAAFMTHGDTVLKTSFPGKAIDTKSLYHQIVRFNAARQINGPFNLFCVGHVHTGSVTHLPGNIVMMTNGCLIPPDAYALSIGAVDVSCGQMLWESVRGHAVGDQRFIVVDDADEDKGYNEIVKPFIELI